MRALSLFDGPGSPLRILALGAHADDIEIGAAGLLLELAASRSDLEIGWIVLSGDDARAAEAVASATRLLDGRARLSVETNAFRERFFPHLPELKEHFDDLGRRFELSRSARDKLALSRDLVPRSADKRDAFGDLVEKEIIKIVPADPQVIYVPQYNPQTVYTTPPPPPQQQSSSSGDAVAAGLIGFTAGILLGAAISNNNYGYSGWGAWGCGWHTNTVVVRGGAWRVPPGARYPYARPVNGYRAPANVYAPRSSNVNINRNVNVNNVNVNNVNRQNTANNRISRMVNVEARKPRILILDEATSQIDVESERQPHAVGQHLAVLLSQFHRASGGGPDVAPTTLDKQSHSAGVLCFQLGLGKTGVVAVELTDIGQ
jgi:hypothetical protein